MSDPTVQPLAAGAAAKPKSGEEVIIPVQGYHGKDWKPFELSGFWGFLTGHPALAAWFKFRWMVQYPLQARVPYTDFTVGELAIAYPILIAITLVCGIQAFAPNNVTLEDALLKDGEDESVGSTGSIAAGPLCLTFVTACHNSLVTFFLGVPFERALTFHKLCAYCAILCGVFHGYDAFHGEFADSWSETFKGGMGLSGSLGVIMMIALFLTSLWWLRRYLFNLFYLFHIALVVATIAFIGMHSPGISGLGMILWLIDLLFRYIWQVWVLHPQKVTAVALPANVIRISWPKGKFQYKGGQYVFICLPKLGFFDWHPFSISSAPHEDSVSIHIRVLGDWTKRLYDHLSEASQNGQGPQEMRAFIEGPYGEPRLDVESDRYKCMLLISGGIGITPMQSITNTVLHEMARGREMKKIWFVWSCADRYMVNALHDTSYAAQLPTNAPKSFQPQLLSKVASSISRANGKVTITSDEPLHSEFYLTRVRNKSEYADAGIAPEVQECLRMGRPNVPQIFEDMRQVAKEVGETEVAVLTCGPAPLVKSVRHACTAQSMDGVRFHFHSETFEF